MKCTFLQSEKAVTAQKQLPLFFITKSVSTTSLRTTVAPLQQNTLEIKNSSAIFFTGSLSFLTEIIHTAGCRLHSALVLSYRCDNEDKRRDNER